MPPSIPAIAAANAADDGHAAERDARFVAVDVPVPPVVAPRRRWWSPPLAGAAELVRTPELR
jgi:hypothetical protein